MIELIFRMFNSLLGYLFCLFATILHFKLFQQETMVEMMTNLGNTSQSLLDNQKKYWLADQHLQQLGLSKFRLHVAEVMEEQ